ncbi:MAG: hypothetical protein ACFCUU_19355 [Cyclobacteriaceae bacterium]
MTKSLLNTSKQIWIYTSVYLCLATSSWAQSPNTISYQAVIRDADNALVAGRNIAMQISILQGDTNGTAIYVETHNAPSNNQGLVTIAIGSGTRVSGDFSNIDWSKGPYFIKTETDPTGGTNYIITGTSQLMSVPFALHAKSVEGISATDIDNLANLSGVNSGDQDLSGLATQNALGDSMEHIRREIPDVRELATNRALTTGLESKVDKESGKGLMSDGTTPGQMQFWNGSAWLTVASGSNGQVLTYINGVPTWTGTSAGSTDVVTPSTGKIWMDRNLGASQIATSSTDAAAYGDLYQWGRGTDGHQIRTSGTTTTLSNTDTPGHGDFIITGSSPWDWRSLQNDNLWQGISGNNNPCPNGYRLPTEAEWNTERQSWSSNNSVGAFNSPLKLPRAGVRNFSFGLLTSVGLSGHYWSSTVNSGYSRNLFFNQSNAGISNTGHRGSAMSVRCIKE